MRLLEPDACRGLPKGRRKAVRAHNSPSAGSLVSRLSLRSRVSLRVSANTQKSSASMDFYETSGSPF